MLQTSAMTIPLWGLVIYIGWTIAIVVLLINLRIRHLAKGGAVQDFGIQNDASPFWRLFRVQSNLAENLPIYLGVVFLLTVRGTSGVVVDGVVVTYIGFRLVHSIIHILGMNPIFRVLCLAIQFIALSLLILLAIIH
jgi:uncharacterized MAPEG superfamily protein